MSSPSNGPTLATWTRNIERSAIQDALQSTARPGLLSLGLGLPAAELFPTAALSQAAARVLEQQPRALQYDPGLDGLKAQVVALMALRGVRCTPAQIFLTAGAQQGMNLLARLLLDPGKPVLMEDRIYTGFQQMLDPFQPRRLTVGTLPDSGMDVDQVAALLGAGERPAFIYAMSDGHNPLGISMSERTRARLAELARAYRVPILEDDAYGLLSYEAKPLPPLKAFEDRWVYYMGSFSKILAPALRVGWLVVPEELITRLSIVKEASDIDTVTYPQRIANAFLEAGHLPEHLAMLRREYGARRDALLRALEAHLPQGSRWTRPSSGMFVWVELPPELDTVQLLLRAVEEEQVAFLPGQAFVVPGGRSATHCMRLNFSNANPARIEDGVARIGRALQRMRR